MTARTLQASVRTAPALSVIGCGLAEVTRLDSVPQPYVEDRVPTQRAIELMGIRSSLSLIAGRLSQNEERIKRSIAEIEGCLKRLRDLEETKE